MSWRNLRKRSFTAVRFHVFVKGLLGRKTLSTKVALVRFFVPMLSDSMNRQFFRIGKSLKACLQLSKSIKDGEFLWSNWHCKGSIPWWILFSCLSVWACCLKPCEGTINLLKSWKRYKNQPTVLVQFVLQSYSIVHTPTLQFQIQTQLQLQMPT